MPSKKNRSKRLIISLIVFVIVVTTGISLFHKFSYQASSEAIRWVEMPKVTEVQESSEYIYFKPLDDDEHNRPTILFYNGAFVDERAYSKLATKLAEEGFPVYIIKSVFNFPLLASNDSVLKLLQSDDQVIFMGHSLGGVQASLALNNLLTDEDSKTPTIAGLVLLASYPAAGDDLSQLDQPVLSITAGEDQVINNDKYNEAKTRLPKQTIYYTIEGGNHAGFGDYGPQDGDGLATISSQAQIDAIVEQINNIW